ncbi:hypothetical protein [Paenibacillus agricola]|nr:hypothetical protein [Paenibacillus agricola]
MLEGSNVGLMLRSDSNKSNRIDTPRVKGKSEHGQSMPAVN